jgi:small subunit ribosomal protein S6
MAMRSYEAMFLLDTGKMAGDLNKAADTLAQIVTKHGGEVIVHRVWDERRLAYPVKKQRKALYYLMSLKAIGSAITAIEADLKLQEFVLRSMFLVIDPKLAESMVAVARDPNAVALQTVTEPPDEDLFDPAPDRNRRRRPVEVREG